MPAVNLTLSDILLTMQGSKGPDNSEYQRRGIDSARVRRLEEYSCRSCESRGKAMQGHCLRAIPSLTLSQLRQSLWSLSSEERAHLLRTLHQAATETGDKETRRPGEAAATWKPASQVAWQLAGHRVCYPTFCALLGMGPATVRKALSGVPDSRRSTVGEIPMKIPREKQQALWVHTFFSELYTSCAEPVPEDAACAALRSAVNAAGSVDQAILAEFDPWAESVAFEENAALMDISDGYDLNHLVRLAHVHGETGLAQLPVRKIQHGKPTDLFWQFKTWWEAAAEHSDCHWPTPPSESTFFREWKKWKNIIRFRKSSSHAQCVTCFELQQTIRSKTTRPGDKAQANILLREHLMEQYLDRTIYWALRLKSRQHSPVLTIIIDSMDRVKFMWPKWDFGRVSKSLAKLHRPRYAVTAAVAHGYGTYVFGALEDQIHGGDHYNDVLCQMFDAVDQEARRLGVPFPEHLVLLSDNTPAQAKNNEVTRFLAYLVARGKFRTANLLFLMVGHTHEDIDQFFSVCTALLHRARKLDTYRDMLSYLDQGLRAQVEAKGEDFKTVHMSGVRDFKEWLDPMCVHLKGAFKPRFQIQAPHSFTFKQRVDLTSDEAGLVEPGRPCDVFSCVKMYIRDTKNQQKPVLVLPEGRLESVTGFQPSTLVPRKPWTDDQIEHFLTLARECDGHLGKPEAAAALRAIVNATVPSLDSLRWLGTAGQARADVVPTTGNPYYTHLPETSWELQAQLGQHLKKRKRHEYQND